MSQYDVNLREYWWIFRKRKFIVLIITLVVGLFSTLFAVLKAPVPIYSTFCIIEFEKKNTVEGLYASSISFFESDSIETQTSIVKSYPVFQKTAVRLGLIEPVEVQDEFSLNNKMINIIESLQSKVEVSREGFTNILHIKVTDVRPDFAQILANTVALTYKGYHTEQLLKRTMEAIKYIKDQLRDVRLKLRNAEDEFNRFSQENELISIDLQSETLLARGQKLKDEIRELQEGKREFKSISQKLEQFLKEPSGSSHDFYSSKAKNRYQGTNDVLVEQMIRRTTLLKDFTPKHPEIVAISRQIVESAQKMAILLKLQIKEEEKREISLKEDLGQVDRKTMILMDKKLEFNRLKRTVDLNNEMTVLLERKNQEAMIRRAERPEVVTIVKPALLPTSPINPPNTLATGVMGVIIGVVLGLVAAFVVETFDTSLGAIEDVEETLGTQVLGVVPQADIQDVRESLIERFPSPIRQHTLDEAINLISHFSPKSMIAESFRSIRTNIQFKDVEKKIKTIAVASTTREEGKTLVSINLAITMVQAGMKVLLVGCDLRKPTLGRKFGVELSPGLTDVLLGSYSWRDTLKGITDIIMGKMTMDEVLVTPGFDKLNIITSGAIPPNPAELIDSKRLKDFIQEAKKEYDLVIFDSAPILSTADAAILSTKVDGLLLVYRVGNVSRGLLRRSAAQLEQVNCNIIGVVLNGMRPDVSPYFQDQAYYNYYAYGDEEKRVGWFKKKFSFLRRKGNRNGKEPEQKISQWEEEKKPQGEGEGKMSVYKFSILLLAMAFMVTGSLWQYGVTMPIKWLKSEGVVEEEETGPYVRKKIANAGVLSRPQFANPEGASAAPEKVSGINEARATDAADSTGGGAGVETRVSIPEAMISKREVQPTPNGFSRERKPAVPDQTQKRENKTVVPEPQVTKKDASQAYSRPYSLYLGSFQTLTRAKKAVSILEKKGIAAHWVEVYLSNGLWYRVYAGQFGDAAEAEKYRQEKKVLESVVKEVSYANLIGAFSSPEELQKKIGSLRDLGYSPYTMKDDEGRSVLLVGAFFPEFRAKRQQQELKSKGLQSWIVKR